jgi:hypothetical protein
MTALGDAALRQLALKVLAQHAGSAAGAEALMLTAELEDSYVDLRFSPHGTAFLTDTIIMQRYIELKGQLRRVMAVVKVRGSAHSKELRAFEITEDGIVVGEALGSYDGLLTGSPVAPAGAEPARARRKTRRETR